MGQAHSGRGKFGFWFEIKSWNQKLLICGAPSLRETHSFAHRKPQYEGDIALPSGSPSLRGDLWKSTSLALILGLVELPWGPGGPELDGLGKNLSGQLSFFLQCLAVVFGVASSGRFREGVLPSAMPTITFPALPSLTDQRSAITTLKSVFRFRAGKGLGDL